MTFDLVPKYTALEQESSEIGFALLARKWCDLLLVDITVEKAAQGTALLLSHHNHSAFSNSFTAPALPPPGHTLQAVKC